MKSSGSERRDRIQNAPGEYKIDALICALPANVLMMSGYWPLVRTGVAIAFCDRDYAVRA